MRMNSDSISTCVHVNLALPPTMCYTRLLERRRGVNYSVLACVLSIKKRENIYICLRNVCVCVYSRVYGWVVCCFLAIQLSIDCDSYSPARRIYNSGRRRCKPAKCEGGALGVMCYGWTRRENSYADMRKRAESFRL